MKILVTGGAGFVGSGCLRYLLSQGVDAYAFDNLVEGLGHPQAVPDPDRFIKGDILDTPALVAALKKIDADAVMHFAAATSVPESVENPEYHYRNNILGTMSLLNAMRQCGVKRMLFSSTGATYGLTPKLPMGEDTIQDPCCPYARTKLAVEWMLHDFAEAYDMGFTILRYFNVCGASACGNYGEDRVGEYHLIPLVLQVPLGQRDKIKIFGNDYPTPDGTCIRDYVHVDDLASAHWLAIQETTPQTREVFNIGTGTGQSVMQIIKACEEVTGQSIKTEIIERRPGDPPALVADSTKLKTQLGWVPKYMDIRDTIATSWKWHQTHPQGYHKGVATCATI